MCSKNSSRIVFFAHNRQLGITWQVCRGPAGHSACTGTVLALFFRANAAFCLLPLVQDCHFYADSRPCHQFLLLVLNSQPGPAWQYTWKRDLQDPHRKSPRQEGTIPGIWGSVGSCRPCWGSRALCWLHQAWGNQNHVSPHSWECFKARSDGALTSVLFVEGVPACGSKAGARWDAF